MLFPVPVCKILGIPTTRFTDFQVHSVFVVFNITEGAHSYGYNMRAALEHPRWDLMNG